MSLSSVVIVGAGHSGAKAAASLRKNGWTGAITMVGDESHLPYDRPPLSKAVLLGKKTADQCALFPHLWYEKSGVKLVLGQPAMALDRDRGLLVLGDGREVSYDRLLLATGSRLNELSIPGSDLGNVWPLRTPHHANSLARVMKPGRQLVVLGAGVIGLEVAAAAVELGCSVIVLERGQRAMGRSVPLEVSQALLAEHRARGVDIRFETYATALLGDRLVSGVQLNDGKVLNCDAVIHGLGVKPRTELAEAAGLKVMDGVVTDGHLRTADERIFACGDVCRYDSNLFGGSLRLENWRNAEDQATTAAANMLGAEQRFDEVPWFWSNQYAFNLQVVGLPTQGTSVVERTVDGARIYLSIGSNGRLIGASAIGPVLKVASPMRKLKGAIAQRAEAAGIFASLAA